VDHDDIRTRRDMGKRARHRVLAPIASSDNRNRLLAIAKVRWRRRRRPAATPTIIGDQLARKNASTLR
jgi:hypothetical protein